jgi:hypothetical protein
MTAAKRIGTQKKGSLMVTHPPDRHKPRASTPQAPTPQPGAPDALAGAVLERPELPPGAQCPYARCPNYPRVVRLARMVRDLAQILADTHPQKGA